MTDVFAPAELAGIRFQNRVIRSATMEDGADDKGFPTEGLTKKYLALAKGGVGGIITGFMGITAEGKAQQPGMVLLDDDAKIGPLKSLTDAVHEASVPIIAQIAHCGRNSVSGRKFDVNKMSDAELEKMITDFIAAAVRTQKAGFDGVQVHFAHGYFLSEVLSPATNHRTDKWGGSEEKRFYMGERIISGIKKELPGYPIFVKIHGEHLPVAFLFRLLQLQEVLFRLFLIIFHLQMLTAQELVDIDPKKTAERQHNGNIRHAPAVFPFGNSPVRYTELFCQPGLCQAGFLSA